MFCPNKNNPNYQKLVSILGETDAFIIWNKSEGKINFETDAYYKSLLFKSEGNEEYAILNYIKKFKDKNYRNARFSNEYYENAANNFKEKFKKVGIDVDIVIDYFSNEAGFVQNIGGNKFQITINPVNMKEDTLFHEFGHIFVDILGYNNPLIQSAINIAKESNVYNKIKLLYEDKFKDLTEEVREQLINKEVLTTLLGEEVSSLYREKTQYNRWESIKNAILEAIKNFFGVSRNAIEQLAYSMVFNPIANNRINKEFNTYVQFHAAATMSAKLDKSIDGLYDTLYMNMENIKKYMNTINESDFNDIKKSRLSKFLKDIVSKEEWSKFEDVEKKAYLLNILKSHKALQNVFYNSLSEIKKDLSVLAKDDGAKLKDIGTEEYRNKIIANLVEFNNINELITSTNREITGYFVDNEFLDELYNLGFDKIEEDVMRKIYFDTKKLISHVNSINSNLKHILNPAQEKVLNYLLERYSNNPEFIEYFDSGENVAKKIIKGEIKIKDSGSIGIELNALLNSENTIAALISKIYSMQGYKMRLDKNKKMKKLDEMLKKNKGITKSFVNKSGFFLHKHDMKAFWRDYFDTELKGRKQFLNDNVEFDQEFFTKLDMIINKFEALAEANNMTFELDDYNNIGTSLYIHSFKSEVESIGGVIKEYTSNKTGKIGYNVYPKIDDNTKFKTNKYLNNEYVAIEKDASKFEVFNLMKEVCEDIGMKAYNSDTNNNDVHIPFESKDKQDAKEYSKVFSPESVREDINGLIVENRRNPLNKMLNTKPFVKMDSELRATYKNAKSNITKDLIEKKIVEKANEDRHKFQVSDNIVFQTIEDIKKYNADIASQNEIAHQSSLNMENLEERIYDLFRKGYEMEAKKEIHSRMVFLYQQVNKINRSGNQKWGNSVKQIARFYDQVYNGNFKNNPHAFVNKAMDQVTHLTSRIGMGLNLHSGIKNIGTGVSENLIESSSFYTRTEYSKASARVFSILHTFARDWSLPKGQASTKEGAIFKNLPVFQTIRAMTDIFTTNDLDSRRKALKYTDDALFFLQDTTEFYLINTLYLAMMNSHRVVNGKIMSFQDFKKQHNKTKRNEEKISEKQIKSIFAKHSNDFNLATSELKEIKDKINKKNIENKKHNDSIEKELKEEFEKHTSVFDSIEYENETIDVNPDLLEELTSFMTRVKTVNQSNQGIYNIEEKSQLERYAVFRMAMQFRHWALPFWDKRFGRVFFREYYDEGLQSTQKGMYHSLMDFLGLGLAREAVKEYALMPATTRRDVSQVQYVFDAIKERYMKFSVYNELMTDVDRNNLKRVLNDTIMLAVLLLAYFGLKGIGDDDKEKLENSFFLQMALYQADAISTEVASMNPFFGMGNEMSKMIRTPAASLMTMRNAGNFFYYTLGHPFMEDKSLIFQTGEHKGRYKSLVYGMKSTPGLNQLYRIYNMSRNYQFYRLRKKPFVQFIQDYFPGDFRKM